MKDELLLSVISDRRSARRFGVEHISDDTIEKILSAARWAPCGANLQPWEIIVVTDDEKRNTIRKSIYPHRRETEMNSMFFIVCGDTRMKEYYPSQHNAETREYTFTVSIAAAIQNMLLMATALDLGSLWRTVFSRQADALRKLLDLPEFIRVMSVIEVGFLVNKTRAPPKRKVEEFSHLNGYDKGRIIDAKEAWLKRAIHSPRQSKK